jgi:ligand-binding sensor domain-containing protein
MLLAWCPGLFALNPSLDVNQYAHTRWKVSEGFCKGVIRSLAQTLDGYLWVGTDFVGIPGQGERDSGVKPNSVPG